MNDIAEIKKPQEKFNEEMKAISILVHCWWKWFWFKNEIDGLDY